MKKRLFLWSIIVVGLFNQHLFAQLFTNYTTIEGLPSNTICGGIAIDTANNKWFGTAAGVAKLSDSSWTVYTMTDGLLSDYINCIAVDINNNIWVASSEGVNKFDGNTWYSYTISDGLIDNDVKYITGDNDGSIWFATFSGVSRLVDTIWTNFTSSEGLASDLVNYIEIDKLGNKWFGTWMGGFCKYDNATFTTFNAGDGLLDDNVSAIAIDKSNHKWIGTYYGISIFDESNIWTKNYADTNGLYNNIIQDIAVDTSGNIFVSVFADYLGEGGICVFNGINWTTYTETDGLVNKIVKRIAVDRNENLWIATGNGISMLAAQTGIEKNSKKSEISIYPNPTKDLLYISHYKPITVKIIDITGQIIYASELNSEKQIDVSNIVSGTYVVQIINNEVISNNKLIIQ
ncbi:MAG TPA: hypothetical protein DDX39_07765 [Bacteroidales bacterium]|nr:MAG: hypothetical protein A2W98_14350 [Bacteroidetes bacterium GWF2_33_38]OFY74910.1 MAG: hypothetical protein A2265_10290 [Bacteroidetes bacterium RIFOXYA12_FULL_33_9]HBF88522.1 hypothetical protein [Bacteroidales bacterium]